MALHTLPRAIPAKTTEPLENDLMEDKPNIKRIEMEAKIKAKRQFENGLMPTIRLLRLLFVTKNPPAERTIEIFAPKTDAFVTPNVEGDAIELPKTVCIINPATDKPAPAIRAPKI